MAQSLFKPFLRNQLATKAQSFPQKSSDAMSAIIACHKQSALRFHMKLRLPFKFTTPWKTDNQIPSSNARGMPGGGGEVGLGDIEASI